MTRPHSPDDDHDEVLEIDLEVHQRVRAALRDVPPQSPAEAERAREAALVHLGAARRTRRPRWLSVAAAGMVAVLGVAVLSRGSDEQPIAEPATAEPPERLAEDAGVALRQAPVQAESMPSTAFVLNEAQLDEVIAWARDREPVNEARCPRAVDAEQSYGNRLVGATEVEILVDLEGGTLRVLDAATCAVVAATTFSP